MVCLNSFAGFEPHQNTPLALVSEKPISRCWLCVLGASAVSAFVGLGLETEVAADGVENVREAIAFKQLPQPAAQAARQAWTAIHEAGVHLDQ